MMAQMLASRLGGSQGGYVGGGQQPGPQIAPQGQGAADIAQKLMLMAALRRNPQQLQAPQQPLQPNMIGGVNALPQALQAQQMPGGVNA
jgi:hypothetical protein